MNRFSLIITFLFLPFGLLDAQNFMDFNWTQAYSINLDSLYQVIEELTEEAKYDESLRLLDQVGQAYPYNHLTYFKRAEVYEKNKQYLAAIGNYKKCIQLSPFYSSAHLYLGLLCAKVGLYSQAILPLNTFLLLEPNTARSKEAINFLVHYSNLEITPSTTFFETSSVQEKWFKKADKRFKKGKALPPNFQTPANIDNPWVRQHYAMLQNIKYRADKIKMDGLEVKKGYKKGFWMQTYVPFYKEMLKENRFKDFSEYTLQSINTSDTQLGDSTTNGLSKLDTFREWVYPTWRASQSIKFRSTDGKTYTTNYHYADNGKLQAIGNIIADRREGEWLFLHENGKVAAKGVLNEDARTGEWVYYHINGKVKEISSFKEDIYDGMTQLFYDNGQLKEEANTLNGELEGITKYYDRSAALTGYETFKRGKKEGLAEFYHVNTDVNDNQVRFQINYKEDKRDGRVAEYKEDGKLFAEATYLADKKNGKQTVYYENGQVKSEVHFQNGLKEGTAKTYFENGQLNQESNYQSDKLQGQLLRYKEDGTIELQETYQNGELQKNSKP